MAKYTVNLLDKNNKDILQKVYNESDISIKRIINKAIKDKYFRLDLYRPHVCLLSFNAIHTALLDYQKYSNKNTKGNEYAVIALHELTLKYIHGIYGDNANIECHGYYYIVNK